jgi:hypothetical protein
MEIHEGALEVYEPGDLRFRPLAKDAAQVLARTLDTGVGRAYAAANARGQRARRRLFGLSMSYLGGCRRESAYRIAGCEPDAQYVAVMSEEQARAAMVGTWIHDGLLPELAALLAGGDHEMFCELVAPVGPSDDQGVIPLVKVDGSADCYTRAAGGGVIDLKTVGAFKLGDIEVYGPRNRHRTQVRGYAAALVQAGLPVAWTAWVYLDRGDGSVKTVVEPFGREEYVAVLRRVKHLVDLAQDPDQAPRDENGPGLSWVCDGCPFLRRCWGEGAEPGSARAVAVHDDEDIAYAGEQVVALRKEYNALEKKIDFFKAQVGKPTAGQYGGISVSYGKDGTKPDVPAMIKRLEELGERIPMVPKAGSTYIRRATSKKKGEAT